MYSWDWDISSVSHNPFINDVNDVADNNDPYYQLKTDKNDFQSL
jgi:hypothetical protein